MYQYHNNILSIPAKLLYDDLGLMTYKNYNISCHRGKIIRTKAGKGQGNMAFVAFESLTPAYQEVVKAALGAPEANMHHIPFRNFIVKDAAAERFFNDYTLDTNEALPEKNIREYVCNTEIFNAITAIVATTRGKMVGLGSKVKPWEKITKIIAELPKHTYPHSLPENERRLRDKFSKYKASGYASLIHSGFGHKNAEKINEEAKSWVLARWADQVNRCTGYNQLLVEYNEMAIHKDWKELKSEQSLINFLTDPKIENLWYAHRFGSIAAKEKFNYQHTTVLPTLRDSLWYSDGTKMNYYYQDDGKIKTTQVYEVFDTYSEVFLGYHISDKEDFHAQYHAFKMALQISGCKPYEVKFDNQGGTKKLEAQSFLGKLARLTTRTAPYNGKSKTIENAFARFQQGYLKRDWFFTGQNIQAKSKESKANMEMILANKSNLPTLDEVKAIYKQRRQEWNEAPHPTSGKSRLETYLTSSNPAAASINMWDMVDMFWITRDKPVTCTAYGISFKEKKTEYQYMVFNENRLPDQEWLRHNIDEKFIIKYDPDDMTMVQLYKETPLGLRHVAAAETKTVLHRGQQEQLEGEAAFFKTVDAENKRLQVADRDAMEAILEKHNRRATDYGLNSPALKGIESSRASKKNNISIGQVQKAQSNIVMAIDGEDESDFYEEF